MREEITLEFGALCRPIGEQLADLGFDIDKSITAVWERHDTAITTLSVALLLTEAEVDKARKRLVKRIAKRLRKEALKCVN